MSDSIKIEVLEDLILEISRECPTHDQCQKEAKEFRFVRAYDLYGQLCMTEKVLDRFRALIREHQREDVPSSILIQRNDEIDVNKIFSQDYDHWIGIDVKVEDGRTYEVLYLGSWIDIIQKGGVYGVSSRVGWISLDEFVSKGYAIRSRKVESYVSPDFNTARYAYARGEYVSKLDRDSLEVWIESHWAKFNPTNDDSRLLSVISPVSGAIRYEKDLISEGYLFRASIHG